MKVKVNILTYDALPHMRQLPMPSLMMTTSIVSEESLARTHRQADIHRPTDFRIVYLKLFFKVVSDFENKK